MRKDGNGPPARPVFEQFRRWRCCARSFRPWVGTDKAPPDLPRNRKRRVCSARYSIPGMATTRLISVSWSRAPATPPPPPWLAWSASTERAKLVLFYDEGDLVHKGRPRTRPSPALGPTRGSSRDRGRFPGRLGPGEGPVVRVRPQNRVELDPLTGPRGGQCATGCGTRRDRSAPQPQCVGHGGAVKGRIELERATQSRECRSDYGFTENALRMRWIAR